MLKVGWFHLTDDDGAAPLPAAGCLDIAGVHAARRSPSGVLRLYEHKTRPEPLVMGQSMRAWSGQLPAGYVFQAGNEANLSFEGFGGDAVAYADWAARVAASAGAGVRLGVGAFSPGGRIDGVRTYSDLEGWQALDPLWAAHPRAVAVLHVYGRTEGELRDAYARQAAAIPGAVPIVVGECNFGPAADLTIDRDAWARDVLRPFLDWLAARKRVEMVLYAFRRWPTPDPQFAGGTPVDGAGTAIEEVLRAWRPPAVSPTVTVAAVGTPSPARARAFHGGARARTLGVVIHATRSGKRWSAEEEMAASVRYLRTSGEASAHVVVGTRETAAVVSDELEAWHARPPLNQTHLGMEVVQATPDVAFSDWQYAEVARLVVAWSRRWGFPLQRVWSQTVPGIIGHEDTENGKSDGKSDPGPLWDWTRLQREIERLTGTNHDIDRLRDRTWALADEWRTAGHPWAEQGIKAVVALSKGER